MNSVFRWRRAAAPENVEAAEVERHFRGSAYQRHNQRRLEHLASLGLDLFGKSVLELGAGVGDHTSFFLDRGCRVVSVEGRAENCRALSTRLSDAGHSRPLRHQLIHGDLRDLPSLVRERFDIVFCYGLLYHLSDPTAALAAMSEKCQGVLLLETCVSPGASEAVNVLAEPADLPTQSIEGVGCRPTRPWVFHRLQELFEWVYLPDTQPAHEEFPTEWDSLEAPTALMRAVFVGSRSPLENPRLKPCIPVRQSRC